MFASSLGVNSTMENNGSQVHRKRKRNRKCWVNGPLIIAELTILSLTQQLYSMIQVQA